MKSIYLVREQETLEIKEICSCKTIAKEVVRILKIKDKQKGVEKEYIIYERLIIDKSLIRGLRFYYTGSYE